MSADSTGPADDPERPAPGIIPLHEPVTGPIATPVTGAHRQPEETGQSSTGGSGTRASSTGGSVSAGHGTDGNVSDEAAGRGRTEIADRVIERMAGRLAGEIEHVGGTAGRVLGVPTGRQDPDRDPEVDADVRGDSCSLRVRLSVVYPAPVGRTTEAVRAHLVGRLRELTGLEVRGVDISVAALHRTGAGSGAGGTERRVR